MKNSRKELVKPSLKKSKKDVRTKTQKTAFEKNDDMKRLVQLLQIHQIELEHQNEELRLTQQELEVSRNRYVSLFDFSPIPYFTLNQDGILKEVNFNASKLLGVDRAKLVGKKFISFVSLDERNLFNVFIRTVFDNSGKQSCELKIINKGKRVYHVRLEGVGFSDTLEQENKCQVALIDLTEYMGVKK